MGLHMVLFCLIGFWGMVCTAAIIIDSNEVHTSLVGCLGYSWVSCFISADCRRFLLKALVSAEGIGFY